MGEVEIRDGEAILEKLGYSDFIGYAMQEILKIAIKRLFRKTKCRGESQ